MNCCCCCCCCMHINSESSDCVHGSHSFVLLSEDHMRAWSFTPFYLTFWFCSIYVRICIYYWLRSLVKFAEICSYQQFVLNREFVFLFIALKLYVRFFRRITRYNIEISPQRRYGFCDRFALATFVCLSFRTL